MYRTIRMKDKAAAMFERIPEGQSPKLWTEAMSMTCVMANVSVTTLSKGRMPAL